jgi:type II secretory pathway component GspD/PulD (secretin)
MVFLKPTILIDSNTAQEISLEKYNFIKAQQELDENEDIIDLTKKDE